MRVLMLRFDARGNFAPRSGATPKPRVAATRRTLGHKSRAKPVTPKALHTAAMCNAFGVIEHDFA
jgi:hypothetical protein